MDYQDPSGLYLYAYAKNNPLKYLDYDGHECIEEKNYLERAFEMLIIAACSNGETARRAALSTMGLDLQADFRDLAACFTVNFNPGDLMWWANLADCAASFLPLVGESKFFGMGAGLFKYAYQNMQVEKEIPYKATLGSEYYLNNESIPDPEDYWNRQDGYFSGNWWLDEEKKQEALNVLVKESLSIL